MKTALITLFISTTIASCDFFDDRQSNKGSWNDVQQVGVYYDTEEKLNFVRQFNDRPGILVLKEPTVRGDPVRLLVTTDRLSEFTQILTKNCLDFEVSPQSMIQPVGTSLELNRIARNECKGDIVNNLCAFPRLDEIEAYLRKLAKSHRKITKLFSIGKSYEGRDIIGIKISRDVNVNKPAMLIDAGIHSCEWIGTTTALYAIKQLVQDATNAHIFKDIDIFIIPTLNPDGYVYTHKDESTRLWRKTRSRVANSSCLGADANRNFGYKWNTAGFSTDPCSVFYSGSEPFSEFESKALGNFMISHKDQIKVYLNLHSYGNLILHPWGYTTTPPANESLLKSVAHNANTALSKVRGTKYTIMASSDFYPISGSAIDWTKGRLGIELAYILELTNSENYFTPPPSEIIPVGREIFEAIKVFARNVNKKHC